MQENTEVQKSRLAHSNRMGKQKVVGFDVPHVNLEKLAKVVKIGSRPDTHSAVRVVSRPMDVLRAMHVRD